VRPLNIPGMIVTKFCLTSTQAMSLNIQQVHSLLPIVLMCWHVILTSSQPLTIKSQKYRLVTAPTNASSAGYCAVDTPTAVIKWPSAVNTKLARKCAASCLSSSCCLMYQVRTDAASCELFDHVPINYTTIIGCRGYAVWPRKFEPCVVFRNILPPSL
jgi:hypothetical protein